MKQAATLVGLVLALAPAAAHAAEFWVDPVHGQSGNNGSSSAPWRSLQEVLDKGLVETQGWDSLPYRQGAKLVTKNASAPVKGGDTIYLRSGYHGALRIVGLYNKKSITVAAEKGHEPRFQRVLVRASSRWIFRGLHVSPEHAPKYERSTIFNIDSHKWHGPVHDIVVEDSRLQSVEDSSRWSASDWDTLSCTGMKVDAKNAIIRNNVIRNVKTGIRSGAENSLVEGNLVENFAGDGIQGLGDHTVFQYNTIKNCYDVNDNHDDGFQSWSGDGEVVGVVLRGNTFINYEDPKQPHRGTLQGIGCFGQRYSDWVIENNVVITDHWHGITILGARNSRIVNNTVLDPNRTPPGPPWIMVAPNNGGVPSENVLIRNNLTTKISAGEGVTADHNLIIKNPAKLFVDAPGYDLHLKKTARAVDTGSSDLAPNIDLEKVPRPWGDRYDIGAYEYHEGEIEIDPREQKESEVGREATEAPRQQAVGELAKDPPAPAPNTAVETEPEKRPEGLHQADGVGLRAAAGWLLGLVVVSVLAVAWLMRR